MTREPLPRPDALSLVVAAHIEDATPDLQVRRGARYAPLLCAWRVFAGLRRARVSPGWVAALTGITWGVFQCLN